LWEEEEEASSLHGIRFVAAVVDLAGIRDGCGTCVWKEEAAVGSGEM
jgi:hypothetical protein